MRQRTEREKRMVRYLIGEMTDEEQEKVEEQFFLDPGFLEELQALEDELIRDYLQGRLSDRERKGIEVLYLRSPELSRRVEMSRSLINHFTRLRGQRRKLSWLQSLLAWARVQKPAVTFSLTISCAVMLVAVPTLIVQSVRLNNGLQRAQSLEENNRELRRQLEEQRPRVDQLREQIERLERERDLMEDELVRLNQPIIVHLSLSGVSAASNNLVIHPKAKLIRLEMSVASQMEYSSYTARLRRVGGDELPVLSAPREKRTASGRVVILTLAADLFAAGDYRLTLSGVNPSGVEESIGDYLFRAVKR
ncbi:MAG: hypothetical protein AB1631_06935 [Acidobacteriota bacterium]